MPNAAVKVAASAAAYAAFTQWRLANLQKAGDKPSALESRWFSVLVCRALTLYARLVGVNLISESGEGMKADPTRQYMFTWHPHGFVVFCPIFLFAKKSIVGDPHGSVWHCTAAPIMFKFPGVGELLQILGGRPVDKKTVEGIMGAGGTVSVCPGGMAEQIGTRHDQEQAFFPANLGFIRLAIKFGTPLLTTYIFGENQLFKRTGRDDGKSAAITKLIKSLTGLAFPIVTGKFGIPMAMSLPLKTDIHARWGVPVEVGPPEDNPSAERVEEVFTRYLTELQRVFYANAHECLPPEVAARGLKIVRGDGKPVPEFSASGGLSRL